MTVKQERFAELDALRGFAALAVVVYHYTGHVTRYFHDFPIHITAGKYGVQLFFCISGFVIFWTLQRSRTLADFAWSRFSRLYPAYWASIALGSVISVCLLGEPLWPGGLLVNATMLQTFLGVRDLDIVFWTLAIELVFYAWMAAVFATGQLGRIVPIALGWLVLSVAGSIAGHFVKLPQAIETYFILSSIPYFMAGVMFFLVSKHGWKWRYIAVIGCAFAAASITPEGGPIVAASAFGIMALAVGGMLRWLVNPITSWLGAISYTLYLTHRNLGYEALFALHRAGWPSWASILVALAMALLVASVVTYAIERPALIVLRNWRKRFKNRSAIAVPTTEVS